MHATTIGQVFCGFFNIYSASDWMSIWCWFTFEILLLGVFFFCMLLLSGKIKAVWTCLPPRNPLCSFEFSVPCDPYYLVLSLQWRSFASPSVLFFFVSPSCFPLCFPLYCYSLILTEDFIISFVGKKDLQLLSSGQR